MTSKNQPCAKLGTEARSDQSFCWKCDTHSQFESMRLGQLERRMHGPREA